MEQLTERRFKGKMYDVSSGNLKRVGWEHNSELDAGVLRVEFQNEKVYEYWHVSSITYGELFKAESKGKWFQENIVKNKALKFHRVV